jgi:Holliday junction resolvasome RuvABC endonuclease subunit
MILGLDISTSCTGYCLFDDKGMVKIGYIDLKKKKTLIEKTKYIKEVLTDIASKYNVELIAVEENLQAFRPGFSSAATLMKLAQFNGVVQWIAYEVFGIESISFNVNTARKLVGLKIQKKSNDSTKEQVCKWVNNDNSAIVWPVKTISRGRNKGQVVKTNECYDMADAYVIAKACFNAEKIKSK